MFLTVGLVAGILAVPAATPKNVIFFVMDGGGYNQYLAASMANDRVGREVFQGSGWFSSSASSYCLQMTKEPKKTGEQDPEIVYNPVKAWSVEDNYKWLQSTPTDSGASASAYSTGSKTYKHSLCMSDFGVAQKNINDLYRAAGKSVGVVTSVEWSDATPAAMIAHNLNRDNRVEVAREMLERSGASVIMGACHPWYDGHGRHREKLGDATWIGERTALMDGSKTWNDLRVIETKEDFEALAKGQLDMMGRSRVVGTARVEAGLQIERDSKDWNKDGKIDGEDRKVAPLNGDPFLKSVPSLSTMALGALNVLSKNEKGFFLMVEGGAVDHAGHYNWGARMVEEAQEFFRAIEAVDAWVKRNGGYEANLIVITSDHETGCVYGPESDKIPFQPIESAGKGKLPKFRFNSGGHTNVLIPVYAKGPGAMRLKELSTRKDPVRGLYMDNTDVHKLVASAAK